MKKFINSKYMKWFRKLFLQHLYNKLSIHMETYSKHMFLCQVNCIYGIFISWMDLKEVRDNLDSSYILDYVKKVDEFPNKDIVWFDRNTDRLLFLGECLDKLKSANKFIWKRENN